MYTKYVGEVTARTLEEIADSVHSDWVLPAIEEGHPDRTAIEIEQGLRQAAEYARVAGRAKALKTKYAKAKALKRKKLPKIVPRFPNTAGNSA